MKTQLVALALCTSLAYANPIHIIQGNTPKIFLQYDRNPQLEPMVQRIQRLAKAKYGTELPDAKPTDQPKLIIRLQPRLGDKDYTIEAKGDVLVEAGSPDALQTATHRLVTQFAGDNAWSVPANTNINFIFQRDRLDNAKLLPPYKPDEKVQLEPSNPEKTLLSPDWIKELVITEVRLETNSLARTIPKATPMLKHYASLGVNALWVVPIYEKGPGGNGYGNCGLHRIDPELAETNDQDQARKVLRKFVDDAHASNIRIILDLISWGAMKNSQLVKDKPEWFSGTAWGNEAFNWKNQEFREWYIQQAVKLILDSNADGFRCDCEPHHGGYDTFKEIRKRLLDKGRKIILIAEDSNHRKDAFDMEQDGVLDYTAYHRGKVYVEPVNFFADGLIDIVEACKTGKALGPHEHQRADTHLAGTFRFYPNCITNHDFQKRNVCGDRIKINYAAIMAPFIPIWFQGDEFGLDSPRMVIHGQDVDFNLANLPKNAHFMEDVKKALQIRRTYPNIFSFFPINHRDTNIEKVNVEGLDGLSAYVRFAEGKAIFIIPNPHQDDYANLKIQVPTHFQNATEAIDLINGRTIKIAGNAFKTVVPPRHNAIFLLDYRSASAKLNPPNIENQNKNNMMYTETKNGATLKVTKQGIEITADNKTLLKSPAEGHWSIATGWQNEKPVDWHHASIDSVEKLDDGFILHGKIKLPNGECTLRDAFSFKDNAWRVTRRWSYNGTTQDNTTLSIRFQQPGFGANLLLPGIFYYGNPSGIKSGCVPQIDRQPGSKGFYEETRFPVPFAMAEQDDGRTATLHTIPSLAPAPKRHDLWWSLGAEYLQDCTELAAYSGYVHGNKGDGMVKATQPGWLLLDNACIALHDNAIVDKSFAIQTQLVTKKGTGFLQPMDTAIKRWKPTTVPIDPHELVRKKYRYAMARYYKKGDVYGSLFHPTGVKPEAIVYGWCGRNETFGYAAPILGKDCGDQDWELRARESYDFLCNSPIDQNGFCVRYDIETKAWTDRNFVSQGQTLETFTAALLLKIQNKQPIPQKWLDFLKNATDALANRILKDDWKPVSTNEAFLGAPLANAARILKNDKLKQAAIKLADNYMERHLSMQEPYWGGTLDARCEDKEGAVAAMTAFHAVWEMTGDDKYLKAAEHATQVFLTYLQLWDIPMPPGRLADNHFLSRGWTAVSVQNMHLDVYGVFVTPLLWKLGKALNRKDWQQLAIPMFANCGQLLDPYGSQGEQIQQTNYAQRPPFEPVGVLRGGYAEQWTVFWITASFLNAAAQFKELGVELDQGQ